MQSLAQLSDGPLDDWLGNAKLRGNLGANPVKLDRLCQLLIPRFDSLSELVG
jgi:hypothetical protein